MDFSDAQIDRYARHLVLPEVGEDGQAKLLRSGVLVIGAGGLGSPLLLYLAAAGVGRLGVVDDDDVDLSNLQRQIVHDTSNIGLAKTMSAKARLAEINPEVRVVPHRTRVTRETVMDLVSGYDLVADGSDNFPTRYLMNDACYLAGKTLVSAAIMRFDGQLATFKAHQRTPDQPEAHPCYRCLFGDQPEDPKESCADVGVLGALAGTLGAMQATEVIKELLGIGDSLSGALLLYDALGATFRKIKVKADPACPLCGPQATITDLDAVSYREREPFCAA
ncbi:MAG: molybdopterin-synthase adenylyltransferase MoeB [Proteobacteria bacterium]|nr:molybdopterin-synthase adenylyltransferase MoeB [Pseudomonadota bacterium]